MKYWQIQANLSARRQVGDLRGWQGKRSGGRAMKKGNEESLGVLKTFCILTAAQTNALSKLVRLDSFGGVCLLDMSSTSTKLTFKMHCNRNNLLWSSRQSCDTGKSAMLFWGWGDWGRSGAWTAQNGKLERELSRVVTLKLLAVLFPFCYFCQVQYSLESYSIKQ